MKEEGVIKFDCTWIKAPALLGEQIKSLNAWRDKLFDAKLIGVTGDGIGYGNISCRLNHNTFIITGSGTGSIEKLSAEHYTTVTGYSLPENKVTTAGPVKASSESLTHAAVYESLSEINAVFHIHHRPLWDHLLLTAPSTSPGIEYGTPAMAAEVIGLLARPWFEERRIFAMGGHEEGIISFGRNADLAGEAIWSALKGL